MADRGAIVERVVSYIVKEIVTDPDAVRIDVSGRESDRISVEVRTGKGDLGRVIGRRGRVARAIRTVAQAAADEEGVAADVEFLD